MTSKSNIFLETLFYMFFLSPVDTSLISYYIFLAGCSDSSMRIPFDKRMKTNVTVGGRTCQSWGSQYPHEHTRYNSLVHKIQVDAL